MTAAFPLTWPDTFPRTKAREKGAFRTSIAGALDNVRTSLQAFGRDSGKPISNVVISSNVTLGATRPDDPGVAVWFTWEGNQLCIPVDRYGTVEANLQAIHHVLEARRTELRHGTLALVRATFAGFKALPAPNWRRTLGLGDGAGMDDVEAAYKRLAKLYHSDVGGSDETMIALNSARDAARRELGA